MLYLAVLFERNCVELLPKFKQLVDLSLDFTNDFFGYFAGFVRLELGILGEFDQS